MEAELTVKLTAADMKAAVMEYVARKQGVIVSDAYIESDGFHGVHCRVVCEKVPESLKMLIVGCADDNVIHADFSADMEVANNALEAAELVSLHGDDAAGD